MQPYAAAKQWRDGFGANETRITAADLTHMESGISAAVQGVTNLETKVKAVEQTLPQQMQSLLEGVLAQLEKLVPVGTIAMYGAEKDPEGWVRCDGRTLERNAYPKLFAAIGTTNGSTSSSNFKVPDIRGRDVIGTGDYAIGARGGQASVTLTVAQLPAHTHSIGEIQNAALRFQAKTADKDIGVGQNGYTYLTSTGTEESSRSPIAASTGGGQSVSIRNPFVALPYIIRAR